MAFVWPDGVQNKTKRTISQILWTLHLDFDGEIRDSKDAPLELMQAMERHGVEIKNNMWFRMILPHLDGGKYGKLITRVVIQRRTKAIRLAVRTLPEDSHLPDGAGGIPTDDQIDMQLFGDAAWPARGSRDIAMAVASPEPAREETRDGAPPPNPALGDTSDVALDAARGDTRDPSIHMPAQGQTCDMDQSSPELARERARDDELVHSPVGGLAPDTRLLLAWDPYEEVDSTVRRLDDELAELLAPVPDDSALRPHDVFDLVVALMADLEGLVRTEPAGNGSSGHNEEDWTALLAEKHALLERSARLLRRVKDAEERLVARNKEIEGAQLQLNALNERYRRLEANNAALLKGDPVAGHFRAAERFIAETPSDRPDRGRSRPTRPNGRTTGSESNLAYSVG